MSAFSLTAQLRLQAPTNTSQVVSQIRQQLQGIVVPINISVPPQAQRQLNNATKNLNQTAKAAKAAQGSVVSFGESAALAAKRFLAFSIAGGAIMRFAGALSESAKEAIRFEREMNKIAQATGSSAKAVGEIGEEISRLGAKFGVSSQQLAKASLILAQAGLTAKDTKKSLEALAKSDLAPTFDNIIDTTEGAIAVFNQFKVSAEDLEGVLGSVNSVSAKFAVESGDIISAIRRTGGAFQAAGGNLNELMALFTSVRQTTRESADSIATGFRTIFARMQRVRTQNFLKTLGIDLQDVEGQFIGPYEAVRKLSAALKQIQGTDPRFAQIVEELGGFRQVSKVIPLIQQFDVAQKALNVSMAGSGSLAEDAARAQESLAVQIQKVKEQFYAMVRTMVGSSTFKAMATGALKLAEALIKIGTALAPLMPLLATLATFKLGQSIIPFFKGFKGKGGLGFAKGGLVPGEGNRDTVPAMLTPGEFVLTKNTTKNLGLHRGGQVQKFAKGGKVDYISSTYDTKTYNKEAEKNLFRSKFGVVLLTAGPTGGSRNIPIPEGQNVGGETGIMNIGKTSKTPARSAVLEVKALSQAASSSFTNIIDENLKALIPQIGQNIANTLGAQYQGLSASAASNISKIPNYHSLVGGLFETALNTLGVPYTNDDNQKTFDFPNGLQGKAGLFNMSAPDIPTDAKKSWNSKVKASLAKKIQNYYTTPTKPAAGFGLLSGFKAGPVGDAQLSQFGFNKKILGSKRQTFNALENLYPGKFSLSETPGQKSVISFKGMATGGLVPKPAADMLERNLGDVRRARRRRLTPEGKLDPQAQEYARRRNKRFAERRGALRVAQVFDFDDTLAMTDAKEFKDFLGTRAKMFIDSGRATQYALAAKKAAEEGQHVFVLTARASNSGKPIQDFATRAGINIPMSRIITVADDPSLAGLREPGAKPGTTRQMGTAGKKAAILQRLASQYEQIKFYDDSQENLLKAAGIKNVETIQANPRIAKFAKGGSVSDTVPAMLTPGEFVVNKDTVQSVGASTLEKLNKSKGRVQGFAGGGLVGGGGGGMSSLANIGFAMSAVTGLVGSFNDLSDSTRKMLDTVTMAATQFGVLYTATQASAQYFNQYDAKIEASSKSLEYLDKTTRSAAAKMQSGRATVADLNKKKQQSVNKLNAADNQISLAQSRKHFLQNVYQGPDKQDRIDEVDSRIARQQQRKTRATQNIKGYNSRLKIENQLEQSRMVDFGSLKDQQYAQQKILRRNKMLKGGVKFAGIAGALGGAAAQAGGSYLADRGRAKLEAGTGGEGELKAGSALNTAGSYAGMGAAIGAMFGPIGIAVGALGGAAIGAAKGWMDATKEIANTKSLKAFNNSIAKTTRAIDMMTKGQISFNEARLQIASQTQQIKSVLTSGTLTKEGRQDVLAGAKANLESFNTYLNEAAKNTKSFDEFIAKAGIETFNMVSDLSNVPINDFRDQWKRTIESNVKAQKAQERLTAAQDKYAQMLRNTINISQAFESVTMVMQHFSNQLSTLSSFAEGLGGSFKMLDESEIIGSPGKFFDKDKFNQLIQRDIAKNQLLDIKMPDQDAALGATMAGDLMAAQKVVTELPGILMNFKNSVGAFDPENALSQLMSSFEDSPKFVRDAIEQAAVGIIGAEGKDSTLLDKVKSDLMGTAKELGAALEPVLETGRIVSAKMVEEANRRSSFLEALTAVNMKEIEIRNNGLDIRAQSEEQLATAQKRPKDLNLLQQLDTQRQSNILGRDKGLVNDPEKIGAALREAQNKLIEKQNQLQSEGIDSTGTLNREIQTQQERVNRLNMALQHLSDVGGRTAVTMQKLEQAQAKAELKRGIAEKVTFAETPGELRDLGSQLQATRKAAQTGTIDSVLPSLRGDVLGMLDQIGETKLDMFGGKSGQEVKKALIAQKLSTFKDASGKQIFPKELADKIASGRDANTEALIDELKTQQDIAKRANDELLTINNGTKNEIISAYRDSVNAFNLTITKAFATQRADMIGEQVKAKEGELQSLSSRASNMSELSTDFGGEARAKKIAANYDAIKQYAKAQETAPQTEKFIAEMADRQANGQDQYWKNNTDLGRTAFDARIGQKFGVGEGLMDQNVTIDDKKFQTVLKQQRDAISKKLGGGDVGAAAAEQFMQNVRKRQDDGQLNKDSSGQYGAIEAAALLSNAMYDVKDQLQANLVQGSAAEQQLKASNLIGEKGRPAPEGALTPEELKRIKEGGANRYETMEDGSKRTIEGLDAKFKKLASETGSLSELEAKAKETATALGELKTKLGVAQEESKTGQTAESKQAQAQKDIEFGKALYGTAKAAYGGVSSTASSLYAGGKDMLSGAASSVASAMPSLRDVGDMVKTTLTGTNLRGVVKPRNNPFRKAAGGFIGGAGDGDKVPALLEPGEFVLNRNAVSAIGAGKLSHFNKKVSRFKSGGSVKMQAGGMVGIDFSVMERAVRNFGSFVDKFASVANSMNGLQIQLMANHKVEVIINGAQVMVGLQDSIKNLVIGETNKAINKMLSQKFGLPPVDSAIS